MTIPTYWKSDWFIGLVVVLLFCVFAMTGKLSSIDWYAYDLGVRFSTAKPASDNVIVVAIDDAAIQELGSWPWPRDILAKVTNNISIAEPAVVGYALPFDTKQSNYGLSYIEDLKNEIERNGKSNRNISNLLKRAEQELDTDQVFAHSLQRAGPVVLGVPYDLSANEYPQRGVAIAEHLSRFTIRDVQGKLKNKSWIYRMFVPNPIPVADSIYPPIAELSRYSNAIGHLNTGLNLQEQARREPLVIQYGDNIIPSFSLMVVARYLRLTSNNIKVKLGEYVKLGLRPVSTDSKMRVYPYFYRSKNNRPPFKVFSILDVLNKKVPADNFRDKAVMIGFTARQQAALLDSPIGESMPPVIFSAHVVASILNEELYKVPVWSSWAKYVVLLLVGAYLILLLPRLGFATGIAFSVIIVLAILNLHFIFMIGKLTWVPLMLPLTALIVGHIMLGFKHAISAKMGGIQSELSNANLLLGQSFHTQGQLDQAFERYRKCSVNETVLDYLYNLGLDYERKRQFNKAVSVFEYLHEHASNFRDVVERIKRTKQASQATMAASSGNHTATLILSDTGVQKPMLGRYTIERELGRGAMGMVYLGQDPKIGRTVAIKTMVLSQEFEGEKLNEVKERFFREAETAGRLNHPNIVTIYDVGEEEDLSYIAMDYLKGENLLAYCKTETLLSAKEVFEIVLKVADALDYAHKNNVVHRDVKPANIIYDRETGVIKVTDFGVACVTDSSKTKTGTILGSPSYMSPEQLAGLKVDGRSDIFSLGVSLYQLLTGELPFIGESLASLMYKIANEKHPDVRLFRPDLPACVSRIINKALAKSVEKRFQSGERVIGAIERCLERL